MRLFFPDHKIATILRDEIVRVCTLNWTNFCSGCRFNNLMKIEEIEQNSFEDLRGGGEELHRKKLFMPKKIEEYHHHNFEEDEIRICVNHCSLPYHFWRVQNTGEPRERGLSCGVVDAVKTTLCFIDPHSISWLQRTRSSDKIVMNGIATPVLEKRRQELSLLSRIFLTLAWLRYRPTAHAFCEIPI